VALHHPPPEGRRVLSREARQPPRRHGLSGMCRLRKMHAERLCAIKCWRHRELVDRSCALAEGLFGDVGRFLSGGNARPHVPRWASRESGETHGLFVKILSSSRTIVDMASTPVKKVVKIHPNRAAIPRFVSSRKENSRGSSTPVSGQEGQGSVYEKRPY